MVFLRLRVLIALLMIALQASDLVVCAVGHSHAGHAQCRDSAVVADAHSHCAHGSCGHHHVATSETPTPCSESPQPDPARHDDCAICRHFSQPAACVVVALVMDGGERVESLAAPLHVFASCALSVEHPARGPPSLCA